MPLARVVRSGIVEAVHLGSVAVCDPDGRLIAAAGDPTTVAFARSSLKPLQAAVSLDIAGERPPAEEIAVMCASHNGEEVHVAAVRSLLSRVGLGVEDLRCPPDRPLDPERPSAGPSVEMHNCSGNHAGMLYACVRAGLPTETYLEPSHPLQVRVIRAAADAGAEPVESVGVDGCGAPVTAHSLSALATMYACLVRPERLGALRDAAGMAIDSMRRHPYLVAGRKRLCTSIMEAVPGTVVKIGAEGLVCAGLPSGLGVAVKAADGADRPRGPALISVLAQLGELPRDAEGVLARILRPEILGGGQPVGAVESAVVLERS